MPAVGFSLGRLYIRFKTGNLNMRNLDTISTRMLGHIFYDLNISPQHTLLSTSLPRCFWALQAKILDNVELNYRKSRHFSSLPRFCQMSGFRHLNIYVEIVSRLCMLRLPALKRIWLHIELKIMTASGLVHHPISFFFLVVFKVCVATVNA